MSEYPTAIQQAVSRLHFADMKTDTIIRRGQEFILILDDTYHAYSFKEMTDLISAIDPTLKFSWKTNRGTGIKERVDCTWVYVRLDEPRPLPPLKDDWWFSVPHEPLWSFLGYGSSGNGRGHKKKRPKASGVQKRRR